MKYAHLGGVDFFNAINSEEKAREWIWQSRFGLHGFKCKRCKAKDYYQYKKNPEIRTCKKCLFRQRLRAGTLFANSKIPMLVWLQAIHLQMQSKRGISALELKRVLKMNSYQTAWFILHKIRMALKDRDDRYKLNNLIELDGTAFGGRTTGNQTMTHVAVETKYWRDEKGGLKSRVGFAKIATGRQSKEKTQEFIDRTIQKNSLVLADGYLPYRYLEGIKLLQLAVHKDTKMQGRWLPWIHKFISNAKTWIAGTHHGVKAKYLDNYLSEYAYRFNRRHDPDSLFHRAVKACVRSQPKPFCTLSG